MEKYIVMPSNLYGRFADDIYSRRKIGGNVLFNWLNNYPPNIKLSIELSPGKFLDTKLTNIVQKYHRYRTPKLQWQSFSSFKKNFIKPGRTNSSDKRVDYEH